MVSIWNRLQQRNIREEILLHQWKMPGKIIYYQVSSVCFPHAYFQEFGQDNTPLSESEFTLPLLSRIRRSLHNNSTKVTAVLQQQDLDEIVSKLNATILGIVIYPLEIRLVDIIFYFQVMTKLCRPVNLTQIWIILYMFTQMPHMIVGHLIITVQCKILFSVIYNLLNDFNTCTFGITILQIILYTKQEIK